MVIPPFRRLNSPKKQGSRDKKRGSRGKEKGTRRPLSQIEMGNIYNDYELKSRLDDYLIYGAYPEVLTNEFINDKKRILEELVGSYLPLIYGIFYHLQNSSTDFLQTETALRYNTACTMMKDNPFKVSFIK